MGWKFSSDRPLYLQIAERIAEDILRGKYPRGDRLPSVRDLAFEAAVNPNTMQRAMTELEDSGLIASQRSAGRFVTIEEPVITAVRDKLAGSRSTEYLGSMSALGFSHEETIYFLKEYNDGGTGS